MTKRFAVLTIHGMGDQTANFAEALERALEQRFTEQTGAPEGALVFESVHWSPVLAGRERRLWQAVTRDVDLDFVRLRKFVIDFLADAIAYQPSQGRHQVYDLIHAQVAEALERLAQAERAGTRAPLCVIANSLGSVLAHNYFYDLSHPTEPADIRPTPLERGETLSFLATTGNPQALWGLRYGQAYEPLLFPGPLVSTLYPELEPLWLNLFDQDDILAYPVGNLTERHKALVKKGLLVDHSINVGNLITSWNPLSHGAYWEDEDVLTLISDKLVQMWTAVKKS